MYSAYTMVYYVFVCECMEMSLPSIIVNATHKMNGVLYIYVWCFQHRKSFSERVFVCANDAAAAA